MELADLPFARRVGAVLNCIDLFPGLDVEQRHELLAIPLWPAPGVSVPDGAPEPRPHATLRERQVAVDMVVRLRMSTVDVAERFDVCDRTVRRWISDALG